MVTYHALLSPILRDVEHFYEEALALSEQKYILKDMFHARKIKRIIKQEIKLLEHGRKDIPRLRKRLKAFQSSVKRRIKNRPKGSESRAGFERRLEEMSVGVELVTEFFSKVLPFFDEALKLFEEEKRALPNEKLYLAEYEKEYQLSDRFHQACYSFIDPEYRAPFEKAFREKRKSSGLLTNIILAVLIGTLTYRTYYQEKDVQRPEKVQTQGVQRVNNLSNAVAILVHNTSYGKIGDEFPALMRVESDDGNFIQIQRGATPLDVFDLDVVVFQRAQMLGTLKTDTPAFPFPTSRTPSERLEKSAQYDVSAFGYETPTRMWAQIKTPEGKRYVLAKDGSKEIVRFRQGSEAKEEYKARTDLSEYQKMKNLPLGERRAYLDRVARAAAEQAGIPYLVLRSIRLTETDDINIRDRYEPGFYRRYMVRGRAYERDSRFKRVYVDLQRRKIAPPLEVFKKQLSTSVGNYQMMYSTAIERGFKGSFEELHDPQTNAVIAAHIIKRIIEGKGAKNVLQVGKAYNTGRIDGKPHTGYVGRLKRHFQKSCELEGMAGLPLQASFAKYKRKATSRASMAAAR